MEISYSKPGIVSIEIINHSVLPPNLIASASAGIKSALLTDATIIKIPFLGVPVCNSTDSQYNGGRLQETTLTFKTKEKIFTAPGWCFIVKYANGNTYLIGSKEPPFPSIKISGSSGNPQSEPSVDTVEVAFKAEISLIPLNY